MAGCCAGGAGETDFGRGCPVMVKNAERPWSVTWYFAGFPKKSTLNSMKPKALSCLITQRVGHSEVSFSDSASSALLSPSLLFAMADSPSTRWWESATFRNTVL